MGGTSCDVALIKDGEPSVASRGKIEGRDIAVPMMDINTVSAGGGTIASVDRFGVLKVGPESAGAMPGAACYSRGGDMPTITDCNLVLFGRLRRREEVMRSQIAAAIVAAMICHCGPQVMPALPATCRGRPQSRSRSSLANPGGVRLCRTGCASRPASSTSSS